MSRWDGMDEFLQVVESGGFAAAARALGVSKAHVSKQVRALEDRLGVRLLHRTTRRQALTEAGERFYRRGLQLAAELEELQAAIGEEHETPRGRLRISVAGAFAARYVAPVCAEFMAQYPLVRIELNFNSRIVDLIEEGFDLAIRYGQLEESGLVARRIAPRRLYVCAAPSYIARHGAPMQPQELRRHPCLIGSSDHCLSRDPDNDRLQRLRVAGRWRSNNGDALLAAGRSGLGIIQLPDFYVDDDLREGRLLPLLGDWAVGDVGVWAVYPHRRHLPAKVRLLIEMLAETFQPQPPWQKPSAPLSA